MCIFKKLKFKNIIFLFLTLVMCFNTQNLTFSEDLYQTPQLEEEQKNPQPKLRMGGDGNVTIKAGETVEVTIPIVNTTSYYAYNILTQIKVSEKSPFSINVLDNTNRIYSIQRAGSANLKLSVKVDKNASSGTYPITLDFSYTSTKKQSFNNQDTFIIKIENPNSFPSLSLTNFTSNKQEIVTGEEFFINFNLENTSEMDANNVNVSIVNLDTNNISVLGTSNTISYDTITNKDKKQIQFKFLTNSLTKEGANKIDFKLTYTDSTGKEYTKNYSFYINVLKTSNANSNIQLSITSIQPPNGEYGVAQSANFKLKLKNNSTSSAKNIKVYTKLPDGIVPTSNNTITIDNIEPNEEKELNFSVAPNESSKTQTYSIGFVVEYKTGNITKDNTDEIVSIEQYSGLNVKNLNPKTDNEKEKVSVPKIIISKYESTPLIVEAGKSFKLSTTFKNTHNTKTVKNIKIYLTVDDKTEEKGNVFAPDNSSTTVYFDKMTPNSEINHVFNLFTVPDAKPRSYTINVNFEYEDEQANEYKSTEIVGVNVKQYANLETSEIPKEINASTDMPVNINFQLYNTGKVTLSNLLIKIEGEDIDTTTTTNFIGNFAAGSSEYYDTSFNIYAPGQKNAKIIISYEDTDGKKIEKVEELLINVTENTLPIDNISTDEDVQKNNFKWIILVIIIILTIISFILIKKHKAKKEIELDEED